ncbi:MAG: phosphotransferase family protein [Rhizobiales bacterium]|nr:phosphotransferase family protein [Hyphomicrobiales bacterium]
MKVHNVADLDLEAVAHYLETAVAGFRGPISAEKFASGQSNPTFLIRSVRGCHVLRRKPPGVLLKSAHAVEREFQVQKALAESAVPVARMIHLCEDTSIIGSAFYLMDHVEGRNFADATLPDLKPPDRAAIFSEMNRVLAALHDVDIARAGLSGYGPPGNYFERQISRWIRQYRDTKTEPQPDMDALIEALPARLPSDDGQRTLVHGDYRLDNMIFAQDSADCLAVLDWELSTIGHPYADLASLIMQWQMPVGDVGRGLADVDRAALGIPSDSDFISCYCERRKLAEIPDFGFFLAFCFFRMAAILQGVKKRALDGNASNPEHGLKMGEHIPEFAAKGRAALGV